MLYFKCKPYNLKNINDYTFRELILTTINDVAQKAGVSVVTASRVINNVPTVRPALRKRVMQAIDELGYVPNAAARSLRSRQTRIIALVVPVIASHHWHGIIQGIQDAAHEQSYVVQLYSTYNNLKKQNQYLDTIISQNTAGVIIAPCSSNSEELEPLQRHQIPTVIVNRRVEDWDGDVVYSDCTSGAYMLVNHLLELGHQRIALISGPQEVSTQQDRVAGYCQALSEAGIAVDRNLIRHSDSHKEQDAKLTESLLELESPPTAIFATTDTIMLHVLDTLNRHKISVPNDMALVCFGEIADAYFPFFTLVLEPAYQMGLNATQLLISRLENSDNWQPRQVVMPTRLILRQSCGRLAQPETPVIFPNPDELQSEIKQVPRLSVDVLKTLPDMMQELDLGVLHSEITGIDRYQSEGDLVQAALRGEQVARLPYISLGHINPTLYEVVLNRPVESPITPEDHVEFARRMGIDAVACSITWQDSQIQDLLISGMEIALPITDQMSQLERYVRATQGTGVSVLVKFDTLYRYVASGQTNTVHELQKDAIQMICDRFQQDIIGFWISDFHTTDASSMMQQWQELIDQVKHYQLPTIVAEPTELEVDVLLGSASTASAKPTIETLTQNQLESLEDSITAINSRRSPDGERLVNIDGDWAVDQLNRLIRVIRRPRHDKATQTQ